MTFAFRCTTAVTAAALFLSSLADAQQPATANAPVGQQSSTNPAPAAQGLSINLQQTEQTTTLPTSKRAKGLGEPTFWKTWSAHNVEPLSLQNSERLRSLIVNGTLYLSLHDMIQLTVENIADGRRGWTHGACRGRLI